MEHSRINGVRQLADRIQARAVRRMGDRARPCRSDAWEIRERARNRFGELSAALDKAGGGRNLKLPADGKSKTEVLKDAGISTSAANRYEQFNRLPAIEKEARIAKGRAAIESGKSAADAILRGDEKAERRAERERDLGAIRA